MLVFVLVVFLGKSHRVTLHESAEAAWTELVTFVDGALQNRETAIFGSSLNEEERVKRFFSSHDAFYVIAEADTSAIAALFNERDPIR